MPEDDAETTVWQCITDCSGNWKGPATRQSEKTQSNAKHGHNSVKHEHTMQAALYLHTFSSATMLQITPNNISLLIKSLWLSGVVQTSRGGSIATAVRQVRRWLRGLHAVECGNAA